MKNLVKSIYIKLFFCFLLVFGVGLIFTSIFRGSYALTEVVKKITFMSQKLNYSEKESGSIKVEESAKWIGKNQARITFDIDTIHKNDDQSIDLILVLDVSESMDSEPLNQLKQDTKKLLTEIQNYAFHKAALITFGSDAQIVSNFTSNVETLKKVIDDISTTEGTNYYQALVNVETLLSDYQKEANSNCVVLFVTDGYPSLDTPNERNQYIHLKDTYPYLKMNAIQYEMGEDILEPIKNISDHQFSANKESLYNTLFDAYILANTYEKFILENTIDNEYFHIESASSIHSSIGKVELQEENGRQKVLWTIENLSSGLEPKLMVDIQLNKSYQNGDDYYSTSQGANLTYKIGDIEETIENNQTPILKNYYQVSYDTNTPNGCIVDMVPPTTRQMVYDKVEISNIKPNCKTYQFLGWKVVNEEVNQINDDHFEMPEQDVILRAEWGKVSLTVSMQGEVYEEPPKNEKTAQEAITEMKIGWNLGNTLDSCNYQKKYLGEERAVTYYETLWNNPRTTKEMIDELKKAGFNSVRVPVTYYDHIDENGKIDRYWLDRVKEVVGYVLDNDMYCILDVHHDSGYYEGGFWIVADADKYQENAEKLERLWTQIATEFKDYDYKLIFEGFNEILDSKRSSNWKEGNEDTLNVNKLNQVFVDTVRKTGGKNRNRFLAVTTYGGATYRHLLESFELPEDEVNDKIILAMHNYNYAENEIDQMIENLKKYCVDRNIPVILDEFGTKQEEVAIEERITSAAYYVSSARKLGITCFWWDSGKSTSSKIFDRENLRWEQLEIKNALINNS